MEEDRRIKELRCCFAIVFKHTEKSGAYIADVSREQHVHGLVTVLLVLRSDLYIPNSPSPLRAAQCSKIHCRGGCFAWLFSDAV